MALLDDTSTNRILSIGLRAYEKNPNSDHCTAHDFLEPCGFCVSIAAEITEARRAGLYKLTDEIERLLAIVLQIRNSDRPPSPRNTNAPLARGE